MAKIGRTAATGFLFLVRLVFCVDDIYFTKQPESVTVVQDKSVTLPCEVTPSKGVKYYWELNGSTLDNTTRRFQEGANLHITRVDRERDSGHFTCIAVNSKGTSITSSSASLNVEWLGEPLVQLQEPESSSFIQAGNDVILRCHLDAFGEIHYEWFRNEDRLEKSSRIEIKKKRLHLKSVTFNDNGVYRCLVKNIVGEKNSTSNFILSIPGENVPIIGKLPIDQVAKNGSSIFLDCTYQGADATEWYFKSVLLRNSTKYLIHYNFTLEIKGVEKNDEGFYKCVGKKTENIQSYISQLKVAYLNSLTDQHFEPLFPTDGKFVVAENGVFQLTCLEPESFPTAKKWWLNPDRHTISDSGDVRVDDDGRLIIADVKMENSGKYTCVAENLAGKTEKSIELFVSSRPEVRIFSKNLNENEELKLVCEFKTKHSNLSLKWKKDGKILGESTRIKAKNNTLTIRNTKPQDRGEYKCEIYAGNTSIPSKPATITIIETLKFVPPPIDRKLELGSVARVHCKAQGTPPPFIRWEKNSIADNFPSHVTDINGTLHFTKVLMKDEGTYNCIASNSQGVINASITIDVVVSPKFSIVPKNPIEAVEGQNVVIDCVVEGDPKPTIHWDKNLVMNDFDKTRFTVLENGSLSITNLRQDDQSKYGCTAGSSAGLNRKETQLIILASDDAAVTKAVLITMSVAAGYIILVVGLMVWCRFRRKSRKTPVKEEKFECDDVEHTELKDDVHIENGRKKDTDMENGVHQKSDGAETTHSQSSEQSRKSNYDKISISKTQLKDSKLIGRGEFGDIMSAKLKKNNEDKELPVLVKIFQQRNKEESCTEFKREIDMFLKLSHENVTQLMGLCRESEPHYLVLEYTDWGDFKQFLLATGKGVSSPLSPAQAVGILHQIGKAMDYISSKRMVFKDLAARNCLVTSGLIVKVGLPKLSRDPYSQEYCKHANQIIPLRWLPYEAVYEDEYSTKSDVYAFGVLIFEIFSQGELPFLKLNDNSVLAKLKEKKLEWKSHPSTPEAIEKLQISCLEIDPQKRPSFPEIVKIVAEAFNAL